MEDQDVKGYFLKRGIILLCLIIIAAAVFFGIRIYQNMQPKKIWIADVCDGGFDRFSSLSETYDVEKVSVAKVMQKIKPGNGVIYCVSDCVYTDDDDYKINNREIKWLYNALQAGYSKYLKEYKPEYSIEYSMENCVHERATALMICRCSDDDSMAYCAAIYYTLDGQTLSYDFNYYICENEEEFENGDAAMEKLLNWYDGYLKLVDDALKTAKK